MKKINNQSFEGERSLFALNDAEIDRCTFLEGESPLKESKNIKIHDSTFSWKYPLWYASHIEVINTTFKEMARSGIWYTKDIKMMHCQIDAPKIFRRSEDIFLSDCQMPNASESLWGCKNIKIENCSAKGDYFGMNAENIEIDNLHLDGNYCFDGGKNIVVRNSVLNSKDSFWNCENVTIVDSVIDGEYLAWNTKNITFINCKIKSHQALCYIDGLKMINCQLIDSDLCFEFCENIDAEINSRVLSIKNPYSGTIKVNGVDELILDEQFIDKNKTNIIIKDEQI